MVQAEDIWASMMMALRMAVNPNGIGYNKRRPSDASTKGSVSSSQHAPSTTST
jgi:hypothetical protein